MMIAHEKILFTGGSGLLGSEFKKLLSNLLYPTSSEFNITDYDGMERYIAGRNIKMIFHAGAFTAPPKVEKNPERAIDVNIIGTCNVVKLCKKYGIKLIYISTDYVFKGDKGNYKEDDSVCPVNKYSWSKLGGECAVHMYENSIIVRTTFGPNEFPYAGAFVDQWTSRESVSTIAQMIVKLIDTDFTGVVHVGGNRKTVYEYAKKLCPDKDIGQLSIKDVSFTAPADTSLNTEKYCSLFKE